MCLFLEVSKEIIIFARKACEDGMRVGNSSKLDCIRFVSSVSHNYEIDMGTVFQRLAEVAEVSKLSKDERLEYDHALKRYRDTLNAMTGAEQKGRAEGRAEGIEQGKLDTARKLKSMNVMTVEQIAEATGLTPETINSL